MQILLCNTVGSLVAPLCYYWFDSATGQWPRKADNADEACDNLLLITQQAGCVCREKVQQHFQLGENHLDEAAVETHHDSKSCSPVTPLPLPPLRWRVTPKMLGRHL